MPRSPSPAIAPRDSSWPEQAGLLRQPGDPGSEPLRLARVVLVAALVASRKAPGHAVGRIEQILHQGTAEAGRLDAEPVQLQIRPCLFDCQQYVLDLRGRAVSLAETSDAHPGAGAEPGAILVEMADIICGAVALQHWHEIRAAHQTRARHQGIVTLEGQPLM